MVNNNCICAYVKYHYYCHLVHEKIEELAKSYTMPWPVWLSVTEKLSCTKVSACN